MLKKIGLGLILLSFIILVFYFVYRYKLDQKNIKDVSNYINNTSLNNNNEKMAENENSDEEIVIEKTNTFQINYTAVLEIPNINLKRGVVDNTNNFDSINYSISVDNASKYPNQNGNFILYAHSGNSSIGYFNDLNRINIDDDIYVYYNGIKYQYKIYEKYDIEKTGKAKILSSNKNKYITLITCNPNREGYQVVLIGILNNQYNY